MNNIPIIITYCKSVSKTSGSTLGIRISSFSASGPHNIAANTALAFAKNTLWALNFCNKEKNTAILQCKL
jgi:hypothetical protein